MFLIAESTLIKTSHQLRPYEKLAPASGQAHATTLRAGRKATAAEKILGLKKPSGTQKASSLAMEVDQYLGEPPIARHSSMLEQWEVS